MSHFQTVSVSVGLRSLIRLCGFLTVLTVRIVVWLLFRRPSPSGLDPEGEGRRKINQTTSRTVGTVRNPQRRIKDLNPTLTEPVWKCDTSQNPRLRRGETGVVGRGGAADPHGRIGRSGVNSSRPVSGRSRGIKFACDSTARFETCGQDGEAVGSSERAKLSRDDETPLASRTTCPHGTSPRPTRPMCPAAGVPDRNGTVPTASVFVNIVEISLLFAPYQY